MTKTSPTSTAGRKPSQEPGSSPGERVAVGVAVLVVALAAVLALTPVWAADDRSCGDSPAILVAFRGVPDAPDIAAECQQLAGLLVFTGGVLLVPAVFVIVAFFVDRRRRRNEAGTVGQPLLPQHRELDQQVVGADDLAGEQWAGAGVDRVAAVREVEVDAPAVLGVDGPVGAQSDQHVVGGRPQGLHPTGARGPDSPHRDRDLPPAAADDAALPVQTSPPQQAGAVPPALLLLIRTSWGVDIAIVTVVAVLFVLLPAPDLLVTGISTIVMVWSWPWGLRRLRARAEAPHRAATLVAKEWTGGQYGRWVCTVDVAVDEGTVRRMPIYLIRKPPLKFTVALLPDDELVRVDKITWWAELGASLAPFAFSLVFCAFGLAGDGVAEFYQDSPYSGE